eukprot:CAMPEP_0177376528 /NCGR_PEP_ID=MMETSP0368-20130122/45280_1 /TAXON_ID=447022 ORGANISM="Scrippsiella hangoei-like, Strain SHHI-4" /NCGR_SAMPLE_ID=MMETSP0368 /ASSEMBLY_ACC=CAM_ASM_000363 /LENGTH=38 /DNA_ID= /DNA_START= /DNA_END= /DNA_ORIENTATION=
MGSRGGGAHGLCCEDARHGCAGVGRAVLFGPAPLLRSL